MLWVRLLSPRERMETKWRGMNDSFVAPLMGNEDFSSSCWEIFNASRAL
jgi:hypothetical protein